MQPATPTKILCRNIFLHFKAHTFHSCHDQHRQPTRQIQIAENWPENGQKKSKWSESGSHRVCCVKFPLPVAATRTALGWHHTHHIDDQGPDTRAARSLTHSTSQRHIAGAGTRSKKTRWSRASRKKDHFHSWIDSRLGLFMNLFPLSAGELRAWRERSWSKRGARDRGHGPSFAGPGVALPLFLFFSVALPLSLSLSVALPLSLSLSLCLSCSLSVTVSAGLLPSCPHAPVVRALAWKLLLPCFVAFLSCQ